MLFIFLSESLRGFPVVLNWYFTITIVTTRVPIEISKNSVTIKGSLTNEDCSITKQCLFSEYVSLVKSSLSKVYGKSLSEVCLMCENGTFDNNLLTCDNLLTFFYKNLLSCWTGQLYPLVSHIKKMQVTFFVLILLNYMLDVLTCLCGCLLTCSRVSMLSCLCALVLARLPCFRIYVHACFPCLRAHVHAYLRFYLIIYLVCVCL